MGIKAEIGEVRFNKTHGRYYVKIDDINWIAYSVYVAKQHPEICGEWFEGAEVHHKDFDKTNDAPENLIVLTQKEHKQIHRDSSGYKIEVYKNGEYLHTFSTKSEAARFCNIPTAYVGYYLKGLSFSTGKYAHLNYSFKLTI